MAAVAQFQPAPVAQPESSPETGKFPSELLPARFRSSAKRPEVAPRRAASRARCSAPVESAADKDSIPQQIQPAQSSVPAMPPVWAQPQDASPKIDIGPEATPMETSQPAETTPIEE